MRDGDIYKWRYTEKVEKARGGCGPFAAYHCKSRIAEVRHGNLYDTFWGDFHSDRMLNPDSVVLTLLCNRSDMDELSDREEFYDPDDIVVLRHPNDSRAKTLVRKGATRSPERMLKFLHSKRLEEEANLRSAVSELQRISVARAEIDRGNLDVFF